MNCISCGADLREGAKFCSECGTSQTPTAPVVEPISAPVVEATPVVEPIQEAPPETTAETAIEPTPETVIEAVPELTPEAEAVAQAEPAPVAEKKKSKAPLVIALLVVIAILAGVGVLYQRGMLFGDTTVPDVGDTLEEAPVDTAPVVATTQPEPEPEPEPEAVTAIDLSFDAFASQVTSPAFVPLVEAIVAISSQGTASGYSVPVLDFFADTATSGYLSTTVLDNGTTLTTYSNLAEGQFGYILTNADGDDLQMICYGDDLVFGGSLLSTSYGIPLSAVATDLATASPEIVAILVQNLVDTINSLPVGNLGKCEIGVDGINITAQGYAVTLSEADLYSYTANVVEDLFALPQVIACVDAGMEMAAQSAAEAGESFLVLSAAGVKEILLSAIQAEAADASDSFTFQIYTVDGDLVMVACELDGVIFQLSFVDASDLLSHISLCVYPASSMEDFITLDFDNGFYPGGSFDSTITQSNSVASAQVAYIAYDPAFDTDNLFFDIQGYIIYATLDTTNPDQLNFFYYDGWDTLSAYYEKVSTPYTLPAYIDLLSLNETGLAAARGEIATALRLCGLESAGAYLGATS